jgi:WD40 repeat protein
VELWEIPGGTRAQFWETGLGMIDAVAFVPGTTRVVASRRDAAGEATLAWDTATGVCLFQVEGREVAVSPDGSYLATTVGWNGKICLWDAETGALLHELATSEVSDWIVSLRFGPDGRTLFGGFSGFGIGAWSVETGELLWDVGAHADFISSLAVSPDSRALAVGGSYQSGLVLWDIQGRPRERLTLSGHDSNLLSACFSPSGDRLATAAADGTVRLWDPVDGRLLATLLVLPLPGGAVSEEWITYTPAGYYLGSAGAEAFVRWQVDAELLPAETYRQEFRRLDLVAELLAASSGIEVHVAGW